MALKYSSEQIDLALDFLFGTSQVTTLTDIPVDHKTVNAVLGEDETLSLASALTPGLELDVVITTTDDVMISIPSEDFTSACGISLSIPSGQTVVLCVRQVSVEQTLVYIKADWRKYLISQD